MEVQCAILEIPKLTLALLSNHFKFWRFLCAFSDALLIVAKIVIYSWRIRDDNLIELIVNALIQLPQVEELRLKTEPFNVLKSSGKSILRRLSRFSRISMTYDWYGCDFVQPLSEVITKSPLPTHLVINRVPPRTFDLGTRLFHRLVQNIPKESPLQLHHLRFFNCLLKFDNSTLSHLKFFSSIHISYSTVEPQYDHLWPALGAASTWLREITVDKFSQDLLDYLRLHSGLVEFCLIGDFNIQSRQEVDQLYKVSFSMHEYSLSTLGISARCPGSLCIKPKGYDFNPHI